MSGVSKSSAPCYRSPYSSELWGQSMQQHVGHAAAAAACSQYSRVLCVEQRAGYAAPCRTYSGAVLCMPSAGSVQDPCSNASSHPSQPYATRWCSALLGFLLLLRDFYMSETRKEVWTQHRFPLILSPWGGKKAATQ